MIEDGDIGYAGDTHLSLVGQPLSRIGGKATLRGELAARSLRAFLAEKFPAVHESLAERRAVTPDQFRRARSRVLRGA